MVDQTIYTSEANRSSTSFIYSIICNHVFKLTKDNFPRFNNTIWESTIEANQSQIKRWLAHIQTHVIRNTKVFIERPLPDSNKGAKFWKFKNMALLPR